MTISKTCQTLAISSCLAICLMTSNAFAAELKTGEWFISFNATDAQSNATSQRGFLGALQNASDTYDANDLETLTPIGSDYLMVRFPHQDWTQRAGNYSGDFRTPGNANEWTFEVTSTDANRDVKLSWDTTHATEQSLFMALVDVATGKRIPVQSATEYQFNMNGENTRTFTWQSAGGRLGAY